MSHIPIIDLFAGPGGLGEGFSALRRDGKPVFKIKLSIEKDRFAHLTLRLRAFFRQFDDGKAPQEYYDYLARRISTEDLFKKFRAEYNAAEREAWHAELGTSRVPKSEIDKRITSALGGKDNWVLIGGPPCQAYSLVGRSRVIGREGIEKYEEDPKHRLYRQYLQILARHQPPVFVMENVKGLLSAKVKQEHTFERILSDLSKPCRSARGKFENPDLEYRLVSLVKPIEGEKYAPEDFVVCSEKYGIPQARHRIIIVGIRSDIKKVQNLLEQKDGASVEQAIGDLPRLRSGISKAEDSAELWQKAIRDMLHTPWLRNGAIDQPLREALISASKRIGTSLDRGSEFVEHVASPELEPTWFADKRLTGVCNSSTRGHISSDLQRYFFSAVFAREKKRSPLLEDLPTQLLPAHKNVIAALEETKFNDRFRVQVAGRPSTTIVSHIAKDGHYFIHYDPSQCRSLTVREAARLQTFPDNYFFEGPRTQQYQQVGNAVPPLLARQIAAIVAELLP